MANEKKTSDVQVMLKEAFILFAITLVAGLMLGFVYQLTKDPIAHQKELKVQAALKEVFPDAASFELASAPEAMYQADTLEEADRLGITLGDFYVAQGASGDTLGYIIASTSGEGYGGDIAIYLGVSVAGDATSFRDAAKLNGISILSISETAGLGMRAGEVLVPQFENKATVPFVYTKTGATADNEIDAITGATITTKAVTNAVNVGMAAIEDYWSADSSVKGGAR